MSITITTNGHARDLVSWNDLPDKERDFYNYLAEEEQWANRFVKYRGSWYDIGDEFQPLVPIGTPGAFAHRVEPDSPMAAWTGICTQSMFDAIVMKWAKSWDGSVDFDGVVLGHATW